MVLKPPKGPYTGRKHAQVKNGPQVKHLTEVFYLAAGTTNWAGLNLQTSITLG